MDNLFLSDGENILISSTTSVTDIVGALATRGCSDLTSSIDLAACSGLPLAGGGFCDVYRGAIKGGIRVAIKTLRLYERPGKENDKAKILKRAARELYYWSKLKHPNVIPLMGLAIFRGHISMISEWMDNGDLMSYISGNPRVDRTDLCVDICSGLLYIHENDMVHGDLKAANVMVSQNGAAMIADFGNSHLRDLTLKFTNTTNVSFSLRWAAPEMFDEESATLVSKKADVYAFGMTMLEIFTGKVPFDDFSENQVLFMVTSKGKTPVRPKVGISDKTWQLLLHCWTWEQSERPGIGTVAKHVLDILISSTKETGIPGISDINILSMSNLNPSLPPLDSTASPNHEAACLSQSQLMELGALHAKLLSARRRLLKRNHPDTVDSICTLASICYYQDRLAEAELLGDEALAIQKQLLGNSHADTLRSFGNLAQVCSRQGKLAKVTALMVELLDIQTQTVGGDHPATLRTMAILSSLYYDQVQLVDARSIGDRTLVTRELVLGVDDPETLTSMAELSRVYYGQGQLTEASSLRDRALSAQKQLLGDDHPDTLRSMTILVEVYHDQKQLEEATSLGTQVLAAQKRALGDDHPDTLKTMVILFEVYRDMMELVEAGSFGAQMLAVQKRVLGDGHPDTLKTMAVLFEVYRDAGKPTEAALLGAQMLAVQKRVLGKDHPDTIQSMKRLFRV